MPLRVFFPCKNPPNLQNNVIILLDSEVDCKIVRPKCRQVIVLRLETFTKNNEPIFYPFLRGHRGAKPLSSESLRTDSVLAKTMPSSAPLGAGKPVRATWFLLFWDAPIANAPAWPAYIRRKQAGAGSGGATPTLPGRHGGRGWRGICCVAISPASFLLSFL